MGKPDWNEAPEYAQYLAMDHNGCWYWYENKPELRSSSLRWNDCGGQYDLAEDADDPEYSTTLEPRP